MRRSCATTPCIGRFPGEVGSTDGAITVDGAEIPVLSEQDPAQLPWADLGVEVVIESTGRFRTREAAGRHLTAGAEKVIISAPAKGSEPVDADLVLGVNFDEVYDPERHRSSPMRRAPRTAWRPWRRSCMRPWASAMGS